jgi:serine/threonine protein kinase
MKEQLAAERSIFEAAIEQGSAEARAAYLDRACAGDADLRRGVEALLAAHDRLGAPRPDARAPSPDDTLGPPAAAGERPGALVGPYKLLEQIGEGGFGVVFMAQQQEPIRRRVALKVLKPGMDSKQVVARFEAERQALALMDHPHIARVLDAGETAAGRPYFAMELVRGVPVTDYCDQDRLTPRQRLRLFTDIVRAVQHAHQKGVIHRDIKPSNVLVTSQDGVPVAKVIDFGIAKALGQQLTDKTLFTGFAQLVGTPLYMSPEQAELSGLDVDTRSDIYSLGVLLYELLTGTTPLEKGRLSRVGYDELRRLIREEEPPRPSTRVSTLAQAATVISEQRQTDPRRLSQFLRGDVDWVVMKALAKDRNGRYATAKELADDVERFLEDRPVQARPPSPADRLRKWTRRHRALVRTGGLVLGLAVAALAAGALLLSAKNAELAAANEQERDQRRRADANFKKAREVVDQMFSRVAKELGNHPRMEKIRRGILEQALGFYEDFLKQKGDDPELRSETADAYLRTGEIHRLLRQLRRAEQDCRRAIPMAEELVRQYPASPAYRKLLHAAYNDLANTYREMGRYKDAEPWFVKEVAAAQQTVRDFPDDPEPRRRLANAHGNLGLTLWQAGRLQEAQRACGTSVGMLEKLVARHPRVVQYQSDLAVGYVTQGSILEARGRIGPARRSIRAAVALLEKMPPGQADEPEQWRRLAYAYAWLGDVVKDRGGLAEAERYYTKCIPLYEKLAERFPASIEYPFNLAMIKNSLGVVLVRLRPAEAEAPYRQAIAIWEKYAKELPQDPAEFRKWLGLSLSNLAYHLANSPAVSQRDPRRAIDLAKRATALLPGEAVAWNSLGMAYYRSNQPAAALAALQKGIKLAKGRSTPEWYFVAMASWQLGRKEETRRALARARRYTREDAETMAKDWFHAQEVRHARAEAVALIGP